MHYRRYFEPNKWYFFTLTLQNRKRALLTEHIELLRTSFKKACALKNAEIKAIVILPEHLHTVISLKDNKAGYPGFWRYLKSGFSSKLPVGLVRSKAMKGRGERGIWQRRYWEHMIRDQQDLENHINYIHYNPVKHGLVDSVIDWPYSSFHKYLRLGLLEPEWGKAASLLSENYGEP